MWGVYSYMVFVFVWEQNRSLVEVSRSLFSWYVWRARGAEATVCLLYDVLVCIYCRGLSLV